MPDVAKLKKKAAELELKKQFDKALAVYVEVLDSYGSATDEDVDVALYNRVGDLYLKQGNVADAVDYYEQAVDRYADVGLFNNAIALCNKILRNSPGRASVYYKLGKISAHKGFKSDAKANFLEYADRMQQSGRFDEAFRALKEFADLCPDQDDIRLMLADQLSRKDRGPEAIEQLQLLYERYSHEGRVIEARATVDRMKAIDPDAEPGELGAAPRRGGDDLVFLDLSDERAKRQSVVAKRATLGLEIIDTGEHPEIAAPLPSPAVASSPAPVPALLDTPVIEPAVLDGVTRAAEFERASDHLGTSGLLDGLETTSFTPPAPNAQPGALLDLEPHSFSAPTEPTPAADGLMDLEMPGLASNEAPRSPRPSGPYASVPELAEIDFGEFGTGTPDAPADEPPASLARPSLVDLPMLVDEHGEEPTREEESIGGELEFITPDAELPLIDLELPVPGEAELAIDRIAPAPRDTPPPARRSSTMLAEQSVELLQALAESDPDDNALRRRLGEAMLESGDREGGLHELEAAMVGFERADDLTLAGKVADEIILLNPDSVRHHQKRVEYAFRTNEKGRLVEAYLQLADALFRAGQVDKSRAIYQRVHDLAPDDTRVTAALQSFPEAEPEPAGPAPKGRASTSAPRQSTPVAVPAASLAATSDDEFVNLGDWLRDDEAPKDTRMVVEEKEPTGDEEADFQDMLRKFKQGIAENVEEEDHQSHYDLGVAYKEMGLLDEAIGEFQKALRAPDNRVSTYEALGQCFLEKEQYPMAATILSRALHEKGVSDDQLVGVLYLLGRCAEERGQREAAVDYYQRVFVVDIQFRDVGDRLAAVEGGA